MKTATKLNATIADAVKAALKGLAGLIGRTPAPAPILVRVTPPQAALRRSRAYWGTRPGTGQARSRRLRGGC